MRGKCVERAVDDFGGIWLGEEQTALPEIIEGEGGERDAEPRNADWNRPKVTHVGIESLASGHRQESAANDD